MSWTYESPQFRFWQKCTQWFGIIFFLFPLFVLIPFFSMDLSLNWQQFFFATGRSFIQGGCSAVGIVGLGALGAMGILAISKRGLRRGIEFLFLVPSLIPSFYIILSVLRIGDIFLDRFPFGLSASVFANVASYVGFCAVSLANLFAQKLLPLADLAEIEGATRWQFLRAGRGLVIDGLLAHFYAFFIICLMGFSIPLVLGGGTQEFYSLDVFIQQTSSNKSGISSAALFSVIYVFLLFSLSWSFPRSPVVRESRMRASTLIGDSRFLIPIFLSTLLILSAGLYRIQWGFIEVWSNVYLLEAMSRAALGTVQVGFATGVFILILSCAILLLFPALILRKFFMGFAGLSGAVVGTAMFAISSADQQRERPVLTVVLLAIAMVVLFYPTLFRMRGEIAMTKLSLHFDVSRVLGASPWQFFSSVALPMVWRDVFFMAGLGALWAGGEFAVSQMIVGRPWTLGLLFQSLLNGYRMDVATAVGGVTLSVSFCVCLIFWGIGYVGHKKYTS